MVLPTAQSPLIEPPGVSGGTAPVGGGDMFGPADHPNVYLNQRELDSLLLAALAGEEPIRSQLSRVIAQAHRASPPDPNVPSMVYQGTNSTAYRAAFEPDAYQALFSAIAAQFPSLLPSNDRDLLLANARDFLVSWARHSLPQNSVRQFCTNNECPVFGVGLSLSVGMVEFVGAYDLIHDSGVLSPTDHAEIRAWLNRAYDLVREATFIWGGGPAEGGPASCHRFSNHATTHIAAMAAIGYVLGDEAKVTEVLEGPSLRYNWSTLLRDTIYIQGDPVLGCDAGRGIPTFTGESYDRYRHFDVPGIVNDPNGDPSTWNDSNRGYGYSLGAFSSLGAVAEMALRHGRDLYRASASSGESLELPGEYYAYYKAVGGTGDYIITPSGYQGESTYTGEVMRDGSAGTFEWLSKRYHQNANITRALDPYDMLSVRRRFFDTRFFGRYYDPLRLSWDFHFDGVSEGWELVDPGQVSDSGVSDGRVWLENVGSDPAIRIRDLFLAASKYSTLFVRMRISGPGGARGMGEFSWQTSTGETGSVQFAHFVDGAFHDYRVSLSGQPTWNAPGARVVLVRFDPVSSPGLDVEIESIQLEVR